MKKIIILAAWILSNAGLYAAVSGPYAVDGYTLHLWHFNGDANDAVTTGAVDLYVINGATVTDASLGGFGTALNTYDGIANSTSSPCAAAAEDITVSNFVGSDGAFTFEAIVKPNVTLAGAAWLNQMQIISGEGDGSSDRGWQFRINQAGQLEFNNLTVSGNQFAFALPTTGDHAYAAGNWYHVAVTYTGAQGVTDNLKLYWTKLNSPAAAANLLWSFTMSGDIVSSRAVDFVIGCDGRATGGYNENFEGWIDEARISSIARGADDMLIVPGVASPVILSEPNDTTSRETQAAVFTTVFESQSAVSVVWYKTGIGGNPDTPLDSGGDITITTTDDGSITFTTTLEIANTELSDAGQYYCRITNASGFPIDSAVARLGVYGLVAYWTLDQADFVGGQYADIVGGHDANAAGMPVFVAGVDGTAAKAVQITPTSGWATLEGFNPGTTGQLTVSLWSNWQETPIGTSDDLTITSQTSVTAAKGLAANGQWQHLCMVFDGSRGQLYINGILRAEGVLALPADMTSLMTIGSSANGGESFNGYLDDLRIYNCALTDTEVADIYHAMTGQGVCLAAYASSYDFTGPQEQQDCVVDIYDLAAFAEQWLVQYHYPEFAGLASEWLSDSLYPPGNSNRMLK